MWGVALIGVALLAGPALGEGEPRLLDPHSTGARLLLYRPGTLTYDNYGLEGYRPWPRNALTRTANPVYDEFGNFLVNGVEVYLLEENRRFAQGRAGKVFPTAEPVPLAILSCYDPRLDDLIRREPPSDLTLEPGRRWNGPYLKKGLPKDPWGRDYLYTANSQHSQDYDLSSSGPDGKPGNDDVTNWE